MVAGILGGGGEFLGVEFQPCHFLFFFLGLAITLGEKPAKKELVGMAKLNLL